MENSTKNLYDLPNEILVKIFSKVDNRRDLLKVCKRFYDLVNFIDFNNLKLEVKSEYLLNENFNFEKLLEHTNFITLYSNYFSLPNFDEKFLIFLEKYGHKIIDFTHYYPTTFNITKFLHFMPNLQILNLQGSTIPIEVLNGWKGNSFPLKKLYVESAFQSQWEYLEIFDIEELNLHGYSRMDEKFLDLIPNWLNLKRVRVTASHSGLDKLLIALRKKDLEVLQYIVYNIEDNELIEFFNMQKNLKSLKISQYKSSLLTNISEIFTNQLESLEIWSAEKKLDREDFMKISNIKSLQSLAIRDYKLKDELLLALATFSLPNLKSLLLQFDISISQEILDALAENFKQIETLEFDVDREFYHEILPKVFKSFNFVKNLIVTYRFNQFDDEIHKDEIDESFYFFDHKNLNLKSLKFKICCYDHKKLLQKIKKDFPNLELTIDEEMLKFSRKITDFPSFCVNLHAIENGNKLLEDSKILFDTRFVENNTATVLKNGKREITFNIDRFSSQRINFGLVLPNIWTMSLSIIIGANGLTGSPSKKQAKTAGARFSVFAATIPTTSPCLSSSSSAEISCRAFQPLYTQEKYDL
ncbi:hypothetical protein PVAND_017108 [Polypedilum vanderplanki]|uniref:F-box domain-containing protein n=1 Tax=Polypedilum vanderplanki TaxID=319348 RepID=A0A9J6BHS5_POLVA|nr:hypothetical protein PVAND_017108 [Polypedilum vanderplanki]